MLALILLAHAAGTAQFLQDAAWGTLSIAATPTGGLAPAQIEAALRPVGRQLAACLPERTADLGVQATVTLAGGRARQLTVETTPGSAGACVRAALDAVRWPDGDAEVVIRVRPADVQGATGGLVGQAASRPKADAVSLAEGVSTDPSGPIILGALDKRLVDEVVYAAGPALGACWAEARARAAAGRVIVKFTIDRSGAVESAVLKRSTVADPTLETCVVDLAKRWIFPAPQGGGIVIASYSFDFAK